MEIQNYYSSRERNWFFFTVVYLIMDYGRPQELVHIGFLRPMMIITIILSYYIIKNGLFMSAKIKQIKIIWAFIFLLALYVPFALNNFYAFYTTRSMLLYMPFILSVVLLVDSMEQLRKVANVLILLMIYVSLYSLFHAGLGPGNYFADENDLAVFINTWLALCYFMFLYETKLCKKLLYLGGLLIGLVGVVNSWSRGGFVGLAAMVLIAWIFSRRKLLSLTVIFLLAGVLYITGGHKYLTEISTITNTKESTANERILSWKAAWDMFLDKPYGVGGGNFKVWFPNYQPPEMKRGMWGRVAHSLWFTLISELGIPGIIIYSLLLYYNVRDIQYMRKCGEDSDDRKYISNISKACLAGMAGYFASGTFLSILYYPHYWYLSSIVVASRHICDTLNNKCLSA